ncbi:MAG: hypothetical protein PHQ02_06840, partial [Candidatus Riflebacteria bacterium]|nr:hypothetical protein [Candidatus Riflebacteria bacterium]
IWTQVSRHISISNAKQKLQHELRNSTNYIQNDFKSIKADTFEFTIGQTPVKPPGLILPAKFKSRLSNTESSKKKKKLNP